MMADLAALSRHNSFARPSLPRPESGAAPQTKPPPPARSASATPRAHSSSSSGGAAAAAAQVPLVARQLGSHLGQTSDPALRPWQRLRAASVPDAAWLHSENAAQPGQLLPIQDHSTRRGQRALANARVPDLPEPHKPCAAECSDGGSLQPADSTLLAASCLSQTLPAPTWRQRAASAATASQLQWSTKAATSPRRHRRSQSKGKRRAAAAADVATTVPQRRGTVHSFKTPEDTGRESR